jgi:hypothetical protein
VEVHERDRLGPGLDQLQSLPQSRGGLLQPP